MYLQRKQYDNKYKARRGLTSTYKGHVYHSQREADYAAELDLRVRAGELASWERQVPIDLYVDGQKVCTYVIDFVEIDPKGNRMYTEVKGFETQEWRFKWRLFDAVHPDWDKQVVK